MMMHACGVSGVAAARAAEERKVPEPRHSISFNLIPPPSDRVAPQEEQRQKIKEALPADGRNYLASEPISEEDIRKSVIVEAKRRRYWGTKALQKMTFESVEPSCCYRYVLESFTETRSTAEATEACSTRSSGAEEKARYHSSAHFATSCAEPHLPPPLLSSISPWDFDIQPDANFANQIKILEMPSSSRMAPCHTCNGDGISHCFHCRGFGTDKCQYCRGTGMKAGVAHPAVYTHPLVGQFPHSDPGRGYPGFGSAIVRPPSGSGKDAKPYAVGTPVHFMAKAGLPPPGIGQHDLCIFCQGRGIRDCQHCKGQGKKPCPVCGGQGNMRMYTKLKISFATECTDFYTPSAVPEILLRAAKGDVAFAESQPYVLPLRKFPVAEINDVSRKFCAQHMKKFLGTCRLIEQRHCVEAISIATVRFRIGSKTGLFYVYGNQRLCYIPKNPSRCAIM